MVQRIRRKFRDLRPELDERARRQWAAAEARDLGWGGVSAVARATGKDFAGLFQVGAFDAQVEGGSRSSSMTPTSWRRWRH